MDAMNSLYSKDYSDPLWSGIVGDIPWKGILSDIASKEQNFVSGPQERKNLANALEYVRRLELGYLRMFRHHSEENTRFSFQKVQNIQIKSYEILFDVLYLE